MSKKEVITEISDNHKATSVDFQGKTVAELKQILETLQSQHQQYQVAAIEAQGAVKVILQMIPDEELGEG